MGGRRRGETREEQSRQRTKKYSRMKWRIKIRKKSALITMLEVPRARNNRKGRYRSKWSKVGTISGISAKQEYVFPKEEE